MYDPKIGRWISEDPIVFQAADAYLYRYVRNNPVNVIDPSGLQGTNEEGICAEAPEETAVSLKAQKVLGPAAGENGAFVWMVTWDVQPKANKDRGGWVIQHIKMKYNITGKDITERIDGDWYEAWRVEPGTTDVEKPHVPKKLTLEFLKQIDKKTTEVPKYNDIFWHANYGNVDTTGRFVANGEAFYFPDLELPGKFKRNNPDVPGASNLRSIPTEGNAKLIENLFDKNKHSAGVRRRLAAEWKNGGEVKFEPDEEKK